MRGLILVLLIISMGCSQPESNTEPMVISSDGTMGLTF